MSTNGYTLYIDTSDNRQTSVMLYKNGEIIRKLIQERNISSQVLLPMIDQILREENIKLENIVDVMVNKGPGSFTGLRVGITVCNILCWLLEKPLNGGDTIPVLPEYN
jgi:tRNA threonylcarbamoyladenosine biosynthesis protein TsaB